MAIISDAHIFIFFLLFFLYIYTSIRPYLRSDIPKTTIHTMSASGYTIHVAGLAPETTEDKLHDFFSFCGKLTSVKKSGSAADITFEKLSAMRTSL